MTRSDHYSAVIEHIMLYSPSTPNWFVTDACFSALLPDCTHKANRQLMLYSVSLRINVVFLQFKLMQWISAKGADGYYFKGGHLRGCT